MVLTLTSFATIHTENLATTDVFLLIVQALSSVVVFDAILKKNVTISFFVFFHVIFNNYWDSNDTL